MRWDPEAVDGLLPLPASATNGSWQLAVPPTLRFALVNGSQHSTVLSRAISRYRGIIFAWGNASAPRPDAVKKLTLTEVLVQIDDAYDNLDSLQAGMNESYKLSIPLSGAAVLRAPTVWGALRALETLSQLITWESDDGSYVLRWAPWHIADAPRMPHRGVMIDTARHFISIRAIKRQIDALSYNKMNVLHWHAVDEQSFPLVSSRLPGLTALGAFTPAATYSPADVDDIVEYARERGVRVLLEIEMPGHSTAWSLSEPSLFIECAPGPAADFGGLRRQLDPTSDATYAMIDALLGDVAARLPDRAIHLGGDEVNLPCWSRSATVRAWLAARPNATLQDLYLHFEARVHALAASHGKAVHTWADVYSAAAARGARLPPSAVAQVWGDRPTVAQVARAGYGVVNSNGLYLSGGYSTGGDSVVWEVTALAPVAPNAILSCAPAWGRQTPAPDARPRRPPRRSRPRHGPLDTGALACLPSPAQSIYNSDPVPEGLSPSEAARVLGAEAAMWGEVTDEFFLDQKLWLRASVLAERLWTPNATIAARVKPWPASYMSADINMRMVRHRCRMLQRGVAAQPYATLGIPFRSRWSQCELWLPRVDRW